MEWMTVSTKNGVRAFVGLLLLVLLFFLVVPNTMELLTIAFSSSNTKVDVGGIEPCHLTNASLLVASLMEDMMGEPTADIKAVMMITKHNGELKRHIFSPLE